MYGSELVEVIKEGEIVQMPKSQAEDEDLFILRNVVEPVREIVEEAKPDPRVPSPSSGSWLDKWKRGEVGRGNNISGSLKSNFHWMISKKRRDKNLTRAQLAGFCRVTEEDIKSIELGTVPSDDFVLINKLEGVLGISLRKDDIPSTVSLNELRNVGTQKDVTKAIESAGSDRKAHVGGPQGAPDASMGELLGDEIEILD